MPRTRPSSPPEFTAEAVRLVGSGDRSLTRIAKDLGVADQTLRSWVQHAESGDGGRDALAPNEREELRQLRREVRTLRQEREILKKAAAFFAKESDAIRSRCSRSSRRRRQTTQWRRCAVYSGSPAVATMRGGSARLRLGPVRTRSSRVRLRQYTSKVVGRTVRRASGSNSGTAG